VSEEPDHDLLVAATPRMWLVRPPTHVLRARLERDRLEADMVLEGARVRVVFPSTWPGEALPLVANWLSMRRRDPRGEPWGGTLVEREGRRAIGTIGCKAWPDDSGTVEVGYGLEPSRRGRGLATEALRCLLGVLDAEADVRRVIAETHEGNLPSQAVLRKCDFEAFGDAPSDEGRMIWWQRVSPPAGPQGDAA
jgi:[ribosomal protein S5]-alanine N-acetyltransferase